eukprot:21554-Heterococcus_DN1.PRE.2
MMQLSSHQSRSARLTKYTSKRLLTSLKAMLNQCNLIHQIGPCASRAAAAAGTQHKEVVIALETCATW